MASAMPNVRLPSQRNDVAAFCGSHVNNLPKVATRQQEGWESNSWPRDLPSRLSILYPSWDGKISTSQSQRVVAHFV